MESCGSDERKSRSSSDSKTRRGGKIRRKRKGVGVRAVNECPCRVDLYDSQAYDSLGLCDVSVKWILSVLLCHGRCNGHVREFFSRSGRF